MISLIRQSKACHRASASLLKTRAFPVSAIKPTIRFNSTVSSSSSGLIKPAGTTKPVNENELGKVLAETIRSQGPLSLAAFMRECLTNPAGGYYINKDPFGKSGDFITSPEISQMFGELVGIWVLTQWMLQNKPPAVRLIEFGPGRGTLMSDMLRSARPFKQFENAIKEVYFVEASPTLRKAQHKLICGTNELVHDKATGVYSSKSLYNGTPVFWVEDAKILPQKSSDKEEFANYIIAHEFFDALPIYQFEKVADEPGVSTKLPSQRPASWREFVVDYCVPKPTELESSILLPNQSIVKASAKNGGKLDKNDKPVFQLGLAPSWTVPARIIPKTHPRYDALPIGAKVEICPDAWEITEQMAQRIDGTKGGVLVVDYGPSDTIPVNSLRGIKDHKLVNPFENPGEADLSTDVDFQAIKVAAMQARPNDVAVYGPVEQGDWLHTMGIGARATMLANTQTTEEGKKRVEQAYNRLVERGGGAMGKLYKVMAIVPKGQGKPVGFGGDI
ncbi:hypothetical protein DV495_002047 [Geotrichum candidum]|uniref:Protein arginine methyltransferase NDUFAF7 n=1 Tax=Geotrichum candidum TaxID=1173061 RepID=A0A0J9XAY7_GEOCN|nr:hypothetical protein DV454_002774 [Geotrichum candidum]KAI9211688.1 hypothetical protein DS838_003441 [Geotrichum bryndzae]KAF5119119.1 hypothetical protein DV452_001838 [Geotrichum candidum]KAF5131693.1 hypothetical protein DV495_002047 [Geotrichum candidum]KAF7501497.1 hypothetical protein DV113_000401 [Geotrichum candidum]